MEIRPTHTLKFVNVKDEEDVLPEIRNPSYVYKVDEVISFMDIYGEGGFKLIGKYRVTDREHIVYYGFDGDQETVVYVEKVEDDKA